MIGTIDIKLQAANPNIPLATLRAFVNSPSNIRIRNVPREIGKWEITKVFISSSMPDNVISSVECVQVAGIWVTTIPASSVAGTSANGYTVTANGKDENGVEVTGYILGKGDIEIINADGTITQGETTYYFHLLQSAPTTPHKGDAYVDAGAWKIYNGQSWVVLGGVTGSGEYVQYPTAYGGDGKWHRVIIADGALAFDDEGVNEPPECASKVWVGQQIAAEATARGTAITQAVAAEATLRSTADTAEANARADAVSGEATARAAADTAEATARREADEGEAAARAAAVSTEVTARQNADTALGGRIDAESSARAAADTALGGRIDAEATSRAAADTANASAITTLQSQTAGTAYSGLKSAIEAEEARAEGAESELNDAIVTETSRAATAEAQAVHKSGNEAIGGVKSFAASPEVPTLPVEDDSIKAANTAWVNLHLASWWSAVKAAAHTISGVWTFSSSPVVPTPSSNTQVANKSYVDAKATALVTAHTSLTNNPHSVTKSQIGLGNCDNTSDANKPISTATQTALNAKVGNTGNETIAGVKTFSSSPIIPTVYSTNDNSTKAASTGWVTAKLASWWNEIKAAAVTFGSTVTATGGFVGNLTGNVTGHASQDALDSAVVKLNGNQSINGVKSFNSDIVSVRNGSSIYLRNRFSSMTRGDATTYDKTAALDLEDKDASMLMRFAMASFTNDGRRVANILGYKDDGTSVEMASFTLFPDGSVKSYGAALASACMPSGTWTTPIESANIVNGATYTADRNGYLVIRGTSTSPTDTINIQDNSTLIANKVYANAEYTAVISYMPILAGRTYTIYINGSLTNLISRFVRAAAQI